MSTEHPTLTLTKSQARRFLLTYQYLLPPYSLQGKTGILDFIQRVGCIQFDPLNIVGHNPDLILQARVKNYQPHLLKELLYKDRKLLDGFDKVMSIYRVEDFPYFHRQREADRTSAVSSADGIQTVLPLVRVEIERRGPLCSLDLDFYHTVNWPWGPTRVARAALESLYFAGELVVHHKTNTRKYYDLAQRHIPVEILQSPDPNQSIRQYQDWHVLRRIGSVGLLWNRSGETWLGLLGVKSPQRTVAIERLLEDDKLIEVSVEELSFPLYLRSQDFSLLEKVLYDKEASPQVSFIAPLDNMMWDRRLVEELFAFEYRWEVYTPPLKRKYGYYVLPVLYGERFIARVEPVLEKRTRNLVVKNWWWEPGVVFSEQMLHAIADCFIRFSSYLNAKNLQINGDNLELDTSIEPGDHLDGRYKAIINWLALSASNSAD
jgi:uncharacterized protein YcaQ